MTAVEWVLLIGGAWCVLLAFVVSLLAVASRAEERFNARSSAGVVQPRRGVPRFTNRPQERALPDAGVAAEALERSAVTRS